MQGDTSVAVVTRFAPSPTGNLHCGSYRTAIYAWLFARKHGGEFVLRIEDTDRERSTKAYEENILESLEWLGLTHDRFYRQSEHTARHRDVLEKLIREDKAYISKEEAKDGSGVIKEIVRFRNPNVDVTFTDEVKGEITMNTADLGDFVIAKNMVEPLFNFAVVVDDFDEGVTHVIRGEDHVSNTPRQILLQRAIGAPTPVYAHLPLVLGLDKQKLSKRKGALAVTEYRDLGYMPEALLNMIAMVGWNPGTDRELFTQKELVEAFDLANVQKSPAVFNPEKLDWFNREYIKELSSDRFWREARGWLSQELDALMLKKIEQLIRDRITKFSDIKTLFETGEFDYFFKSPTVSEKMLVWKDDTLENAKKHLTNVKAILEAIPEDEWTYDRIKQAVMPYAEAEGKGSVLWPLRVALCGREKSPDPFELAGILGKRSTVARVEICE